MVTVERKSLAPTESVDESAYQFLELTLRLPAEWELTYERLFELGELNGLFQVERTSEGALVVTGPPPPAESGWIASLLTEAILPWSSTARWRVFDSTFGYDLPDGSLLVPDLSCLPIDQLPKRGDTAGWSRPYAGSPPMVVEIRSPGQSLASQQRKMELYIANGVQLGWLFDPRRHQVHVYRPNREPEVLVDPESLSGEDVMVGLVVDLSDIWP